MFDLTGEVNNPEESLFRIAAACNLNKERLVAQWSDVYPRAQVQYVSSKAQNDNRAAWARTLQLIQKHNATREAHPTDVLQVALLHYVVFGGSSSGVEQNFSKSAWALYSRRHFATGGREEFVAKAVLDHDLYDQNELLQLAQKAWSQCYGVPRASPAHARIDKGIKRKVHETGGSTCTSEIAFLRKRRAAASAAAAEECLDEELPADLPAWTDKHEKEKGFQDRKRYMRQVQALAENSLLPEEVSPNLQADMETCQRNLKKNEELRERKRARLERFDKHSVGDIRDAIGAGKVHVAVSATPAASAELELTLSKLGLQTTKQANEASAMICQCPGSMADLRLRLISALNGCFECAPAFFLSGCGAVVKLKRAAATPRVLIVSQECAAVDKKFWVFLKANLPADNAWIIHKASSLNDMPTMQRRYKAGVAFIVVRQVQLGDRCLQAAKNVCTVVSLVAKLTVLEATKSLTGLRKQHMG